MGRTEKARGSRTLGIRDWPFGSRGRRMFLGAVLLDDPPPDGWRKIDLERAAEVERGGADRLLAGASALGLVRGEGGRWYPEESPSGMGEPLEQLVRLSRELPTGSIPALPKRPYERS